MGRTRAVDEPLRRDVRHLGRVLGDVLVALEGGEVVELEERVRRLAIERRRGPRGRREAAAAELSELLASLPLTTEVPVIEQLQDLDGSPIAVRALFADPGYRRHVHAQGVQEVMLGYSDSGKQVGLLAASGALRRTQAALAEICRDEGVPLRVFHGRGESVARGGGPAQQAILSLPAGSVAGRYKATEQGEALDHRYARPALAMRTLELLLGGALLHTLDAEPRPDPAREAACAGAFDALAEAGRDAYRALVWEEPRFVDFFEAATPIEEIARLPIGSRPSRRRAGGVDALRAIPWVFAWTQTRAILPGWYGVGSALDSFSERGGGPDLLREMYGAWPFFRAVIDNVEMVLAKTDLPIAARCADLAPPDARRAVWPRIVKEHARTRRAVLRVKGTRRLLADNPTLARSIALRNPHVDPMNFLQEKRTRSPPRRPTTTAASARSRRVSATASSRTAIVKRTFLPVSALMPTRRIPRTSTASRGPTSRMNSSKRASHAPRARLANLWGARRNGRGGDGPVERVAARGPPARRSGNPATPRTPVSFAAADPGSRRALRPEIRRRNRVSPRSGHEALGRGFGPRPTPVRSPHRSSRE